MSEPKIQVFQRHDRFYFRFVAANGEIVAQSEAYHNEEDCRTTARMVSTAFAVAPIERVTA